MKTIRLLNLALTCGAASLFAQTATPPADDPGPGGPGPRPAPLFALFDANNDGVIDAKEIANAPTVLATIAKSTGGELTLDDLCPPPADQPTPPEVETPPTDATPPVPPLFAALDTDGDGTLDAAEIANAATALKTLDKNGDGQITPDETCPALGSGDLHGKGPDGGRGPRPAGNGKGG